MKGIIFIAAPAAGKGTFSAMVSREYNLEHISTGDLLRDEVDKGTEMSNKLLSIMNSGKLVSDEIIVRLIKSKLESIDTGYILDGFPRNIEQALILDKMLGELNKKLDFVIHLEVEKDVALKRTLGRMSCPNCKESYNTNIEASKPKVGNICDKCGSTLVKREDDNVETFNKRYKTYLNQTEPLIKYYQQKGILYTVNGNSLKEVAFAEIKEIIND